MDAPLISGLDSFEPVNRSSTSFTWRAYQRDLGRHVMVKVLLPEAASDQAQAENFQAVSRAISRVKAQSFCQIYDISTVDGQNYVVMEEPAGKTLAELVKENPKMPVRTLLRYVLGIAEALGRAWELERFVHRNLKPTTIGVTGEGVAKMTDFGNAFLARPGVDIVKLDDGMVVGTPNFIAPEQVTHAHPIDCRCDMYALGMVLYYALTGLVPFDEQTPDQVLQSQIEGVLPSPRERRPDLPLSVCLLLENLLMKDPNHRYANWGDVVVDIKRLLDGKPLRRSAHSAAGRSSVAVPLNASRSKGVSQRLTALKPSGPGGFARFLLWMLLLVWLLGYANHRVGDPADFYGRVRQRFPQLAPYLPVVSTNAAASPVTETAVAPQKRLRQVTTAAPARSARPVAVPAAPAPAPTPVERAMANAAIAAEEPVPQPEPQVPDPALARELAVVYGREGLDGLKKAINARQAADRENQLLRAMRSIINNVRPIDELVAQAFEQMEGRELELMFKGKARRVEPRGVADGKVSLFFGEQNRTVLLAIDSLEASEKVRLLGARLRPHQAVSAALSLLAAGDREAARACAASAGPLQRMVELIIEQVAP